MTDRELLEVLRSEMEESTGCTDPGSICLAAAGAVSDLGERPETLAVTLSPNVYKNAIGVGIPGIYETGVELAAALGILIADPSKGLAILSEVTDEMTEQARRMVKAGMVTVTYEEAPDPLYVRAEASAGGHTAVSIIAGDYSNLIERSKDGEILFQKELPASEEEQYPLMKYTVRELYGQILNMDAGELGFLAEYAKYNMNAAKRGLEDTHMNLGPQLDRRVQGKRGDLFDIINRVQTNTAAAGEARMKGMNVTIMSIAGSGNHGITSFVGVATLAEGLGSSPECTARALAISSMITVYIKGYIKRMTAFCGCGVAAATGVAAAAVYLMGGSFEQAVHAMQSVIGTIGGMFCDGAKESCAYKLSTAASTAVQFAALAVRDCYIPGGMGIIGTSIEQTFENMGRLNNPGMAETDRVLVSIVQGNRKGEVK